jgi:galactokinase
MQIEERTGKLRAAFESHFGMKPLAVAYAPGRVEVLGNHTDYNEGLVLSAAINYGTYILAAPVRGSECRLYDGKFKEAASFSTDVRGPAPKPAWANYLKGVYALLRDRAGKAVPAVNVWIEGDVPMGAGLSSSAALEMAATLALGSVLGVNLELREIARLGQKAEHEYAGVRCGLLDQITSLFGRESALVETDFRTLAVATVPLDSELEFLIANTAVKHNLVDSAYNERRAKCEEAARFFADVLPHPVKALRDVSPAEWRAFSGKMDPVSARRSAHVIGEIDRVQRGAEMLKHGKWREFGELMFESHESSRTQFENSCPELDHLVATARSIPEVLGARLSGGGFGGSAVILAPCLAAKTVAEKLGASYRQAFGHPCEMLCIRASAGARLL